MRKTEYKILFLTLRIFSVTGGIEKVCRILGKALYELGLQQGWRLKIHAMHGKSGRADGNRYFPRLLLRDFRGQKIRYVLNSILAGRKSDIVLLSHVNLLLVGYIIKRIRPNVKLLLIAHGIEVWRPFPAWKIKMLRRVDLILPVSQFTKEKMISLYGLPSGQLVVLNNCLDPFLERLLDTDKDLALMERYGIRAGDKVLLTVARMSDTEHYKGYDKVMMTLPQLKKKYNGLRYLLVGKCDEQERIRLDGIIKEHELQDNVIFAGFVPDEELAAHFNMADIFVMPSEKEGFGIVFVEAMFYGLPVIAGNADGSVDALCNGKLGLLVDPENIEEIAGAVDKMLADPVKYRPDRNELMQQFGYDVYKRKLKAVLEIG